MENEITPEYLAALRRVTGREKLRVAFQLYWGARKIKAARLRQQHPDWSEEQIEQRVKEIFYYAHLSPTSYSSRNSMNWGSATW